MHSLFHRVVAVVCFTILSADADPIRLCGSDTLAVKLVPQLCERYKVSNPEIAFSITAEGSTHGFTSLLNNKADIAMSNRELTQEEARQFAEHGITLSRWAAGTDALVPVVNAQNTMEQLTSKQIEAIFTGDVANWSVVGGRPGAITLHLRNSASSSYADFQRIALRGRSYGKNTNRFAGGESLMQELIRDENGISYIGLGYIKAKGVKVVKIDGYEPTIAHRDLYPYFRNCYYFTRKSPGTPEYAFLEWISRSDEAKKVIAAVGFLAPK